MGDRAMNLLEVLIVAFVAVLTLCWTVFGLRVIYGYRVRNRAIEITLFHVLPVYRLPIDNIEQIQKASWYELGIGGCTLRLGNRITGQGVLIKKRKGWFRRVVISPNDPDKFISQVTAELGK